METVLIASNLEVDVPLNKALAVFGKQSALLTVVFSLHFGEQLRYLGVV